MVQNSRVFPMLMMYDPFTGGAGDPFAAFLFATSNPRSGLLNGDDACIAMRAASSLTLGSSIWAYAGAEAARRCGHSISRTYRWGGRGPPPAVRASVSPTL